MFRVLKTHPAVRRLTLAHLQSQLGSGVGYVALLVLAYQRVHSGWGVALVLLGDFLPGVVLSAPFGAIADRCDRRVLAVCGDLLRAGAFVAIAFIPSFWPVVVLALVAGIGTAVWRPAIKASLPSLTDAADRSAVAAAYTACTNIGMTAGPGVAAIALMAVSPSALLAANGVTFAISAALLAGVALPRCATDAVPRAAATSPRAAATSLRAAGLRRMPASLRAALTVPGVLAVLGVSACGTLAGAMMTVAEPLLAQGPLRAGGSGYAVLVTVYGLGMLTSSALCARLPRQVSALRRWWLSGIALTGLALAASGFAPELAVAAATFALTGAGNTLTVVPEMRLIQELTPDHLLGRMFGLSDALSNATFVTGFLLSGAVLGAAGVRTVFWGAGAITMALALAGALAFGRERLLGGARAPERAAAACHALSVPSGHAA